MFLGRVTDYTTIANTAVNFTTVKNSNGKITNNSGVLSFRKPGYYMLDVDLSVTGVTGDITATIFADGVATPTTATVSLTAATDYANLSITDAITVAFSQFSDVATISVVIDTPGVVVDGTIRAFQLS